VNRAAIYGRYSDHKQSAASSEDQVRKCREQAAREGAEVAPDCIYLDEAISGVGSDRPALVRLLDDAERSPRPFDIVLMDDTSRLSRNLGEAFRIYERLNFLGVRVVAVSQGFDTQNEQAPVLMAVHGLVDSLYVRELAKKVHRGLEGLALRGLHTGGRCYGYEAFSTGEATSKRLAVCEEEAAVVRRIFAMAAAGDSLKTIAKRLNAERIPPPRVRAGRARATWCPTCIREMLRRELYAGRQIWNRSRFVKVPGTNKRVQRMRPPSEWQIAERPELRIVSAELWQAVQTRLALVQQLYGEAGRKGGLFSRSASSRYLFSGVLKCGVCGGNLVVVSGRAQGRQPKYGCSQNFFRSACSNNLRERLDVIESRLLAELQDAVLRPAAVDYAVEEFGRQLRTALDAISGNLAGIRKRKAELEVETARLAEAIAQTGPTPALVSAIGARDKELREITDRLLAENGGSVEAQLEDVRRFVAERILDLRKLLAGDVVRAKVELAKHVREIFMQPREANGRGFYEATGQWDLLGEGPKTGRALRLVGRNARMVAGVGFEPTTFGL
jgi:site-specific DNA recombinase